MPRTSQLSPWTTCRQLFSSSPVYQHQTEDILISLSALLSSDVGSCKLGQDVRLCISKLMKADKTAMNFTWVVGHLKKCLSGPQWFQISMQQEAKRSVLAWPGLSTELQKYVPKNICNGSADICSASADWVYKSVSATRLLLFVYFISMLNVTRRIMSRIPKNKIQDPFYINYTYEKVVCSDL